MNIQPVWETSSASNGTKYLRQNGVPFARIWPLRESWQVAVLLPGAHVDGHLFPSEEKAKLNCEIAVQKWFNRLKG